MSADNWGVCPECRKGVDNRNDAKLRLPGEKYGKVSQMEYAEIVAQARVIEEYDCTLREDYELGIDANGMFSISYGARCDKCKFKFTYDHKQETKAKPKP